jgi:hypothetical protein
MQDHTVTVAVAVMALAIGGMTTGSPLEAPAGSDEGRLATPAHFAGHAYFSTKHLRCSQLRQDPCTFASTSLPSRPPMACRTVTRKSDFCPRAIVPLPGPL